ncbi:hypothetical protein A2331_05130 [Candidatus Falkowbacteria bacterium RIFOXYB2_FULL_34_18]|uniref:Uncharacterized protein n=1 Tax=Candidatus Falkowbacteria bacterium RIFOXYD2_FULL_34_120 TaxID=1798007 RepID=A0A1F5TMZ1_9BACT|nr:MAG: hypothetical protein A2500_07115 [Candidatus Falkowbacteria bacterium RIFOXYC12_FULL_34_55]OGF28729.1 MAG: hypothetical protein A2331_05130 [Candidatus Falkowbacteria bacterium RIFOXYB2_FULL_34_18]OGF38094.1 MAG: hypothetical protein A2466_04310 [Candidatus Falkowbacteria bacterium RIFOXYC2_FULL_34_220]OGF38348.1 MAG: hypothetical protein A2515_06340 [Candidatus Falkowbacteria bacterium RIFOXYD12_FULL_34_57]OGF40335.1 MAG: hypothetical protein A2531_00600 [Candidatus Falkowbacteria bact
MNHKLAQLSLSTSNKAGSTGDIFVAQPDSTKESLAGKLFIIVEINSTKIEGLKIINFLIDNINHNYYQNEKIILRERISTLTVEHIFEAALAKINKNFSEYTRNEKTDIKLKDINITVGIIHENEIYFTNNGKNKIFLIYKSKVQETNEKEYQISEIGKQNENDKNQSASQKLFSNVISGKIPPNGFFLFTNEALPEYIGSNQLIKIITTLPPQGAAEQIKQTLLKINSYVSFSAIIIQSMLGKKTESPVLPKTESAQKSINTLNRTEEQTENLLTPSGVINIGKWLKFPLQLFNRVPKNQNVIIKDKIFSKKRTFTKTKKVINAIKNFFIYTFGFLIFLTKNITNKEKLSGIIKNFNQNGGRIKLWIINLIYGIVGLNKKSKIFLILSLIFLILFIFNLSRIKIGQNKQEEKEKYNQLTSLIEQKQNQAEANLLYNNEGGAKKLFDEIDRLINEFPNETEEQQKKHNEFREKFDSQMEKIRKITKIENPEIVANLKNLTSAANPKNIILTKGLNKIFSGDSVQKSVYMLDIASKIITTITNLEYPIETLETAAIYDNDIYYLNNSNIVKLDTEKEQLKTMDIALSGKKTVAMSTYNNRLYCLSPENNQIYRYKNNGSVFNEQYAWILEKTDLNSAVDLSIDGYIYVLKNNGEIIKLLKGQISATLNANSIVDPPMENVTKLFVSPELKYIYVLEPINRRLILFDKTGKFLMQYLLPNASDLKDFAVDEKNKIIYFLDNASIYKIGATHFE